MFTKLTKLNFRRGLFRVLVVSSFAWVVFAVVKTESEISYAVGFVTDYEGIRRSNELYHQPQIATLKQRLNLLEQADRIRQVELARNKSTDDEYTKFLKQNEISWTAAALEREASSMRLGFPFDAPEEPTTALGKWKL